MKLILLASFPRSGNTMIRSMLEMITETYTGSVYFDRKLQRKDFLEGVQEVGKVIFVKSHSLAKNYPDDFASVVHVVRNPFSAILSYFFFRNTQSHHKNLSVKGVKAREGIFIESVKQYAHGWNSYNRRIWNKRLRPTLTVKYEDILSNCEEAMKKVILFSFMDNPPESFLARISCACNRVVSKRKETYGKKGHDPLIEYFPEEVEDLVWDELKPQACLLGYGDLRGTHNCSL